MKRVGRFGSLLLATGWTAVLVFVRPRPSIALAGIALGVAGVGWLTRATRPRLPLVLAAAWSVVAIARPYRDETGFGRLFFDQTYHHQALRALNHAAARGADISEVLETTSHIEAGDAEGWYAAWTALGDRNLARARATHDATSRGEALLRAHTYFLRAEFFLPPDDPKRPASFDRNRKAFYEGLDTLGVAYEKISVPYGDKQLHAIFYPASTRAKGPLLVFCGGSDTTVEELYFFLAAAAHARGYAVLTFEGPGQGAVLREEKLTMKPDWEKPTSAVLDTFFAAHERPAKTVMIGLSLGGYLAARAAAFDQRIDGVVSYDVFFDGGEVARRSVPAAALFAKRIGLGAVVDALAPVKARVDPAAASGLVVAGWLLGTTKATEVIDALSQFDLTDVAPRIHQDVLAFAGDDDQFVPVDQLDRYARALVNARSVTTKRYLRASGGAEHSQLGATTLWQSDLFDWLDEKFGEPYAP